MKQPIVVSLKGGASGAEALMDMKDPPKATRTSCMIAFSADLHAAAVGRTSVQLARPDAGGDGRDWIEFLLWDNAETALQDA